MNRLAQSLGDAAQELEDMFKMPGRVAPDKIESMNGIFHNPVSYTHLSDLSSGKQIRGVRRGSAVWCNSCKALRAGQRRQTYRQMCIRDRGNADTENMLAEYNAGFKQDMRRFLKSDEGMISGAEFHVRRNTGSFGTINYMANQDGFTLYDTVAYNYRHNEANGEDNRDGSEFNYSWNRCV